MALLTKRLLFHDGLSDFTYHCYDLVDLAWVNIEISFWTKGRYILRNCISLSLAWSESEVYDYEYLGSPLVLPRYLHSCFHLQIALER
jgi:hypothetical protein